MAISSIIGDAIVPTSYGFRNVIINGNFSINQRGYTSGTSLAAGAYGFDRWKVAPGLNTALTFTAAPQGQTVTISTAFGSIRQIVERANVPAGSYVLSWSGSALGRVYNEGSSSTGYVSSPVSVYLDGTANVIVEFTTQPAVSSTLGEVQLERGQRQTPFEHRPIGLELQLCQRYYEKSYSTDVVPATNTLKGSQYVSATSDLYGNMAHIIVFSVEKRAVPSMTFYTGGGTLGSWTYTRSGVSDTNTSMNWTSDWSGTSGGLIFGAVGAAYTPARIFGHWVAEAEL